MSGEQDVSVYRVLLRGEGVDGDGEWVGFYTTRRATAPSVEAAIEIATAELWTSQTELPRLSRIDAIKAVGQRRVRLPMLDRVRYGGFVFYNDSEDARLAALRIEARVAGIPWRDIASL